MISEDLLKSKTREFFNLFWNPLNGQPPEWSNHWYFEHTIENHDERGCYALFVDKKVVYIGVGIGQGSGQYQNCGLGYRLKRYWKVDKDKTTTKKYKPRDNWEKVTSILTIGFKNEYYPLAAALEIFLINALNPEKNTQHKKTPNNT